MSNERVPLLTNEEAWDLAAPIYHAAEGASGYEVKKRLIEFGEEYVRRKITSGELMVNRKEEYGETMFIYFATMKPYSPTRSQCSRCNHSWLTAEAPRIGGFCMCGSKIIDA